MGGKPNKIERGTSPASFLPGKPYKKIRDLKRQTVRARRRSEKLDPTTPGRVRDITKGWSD